MGDPEFQRELGPDQLAEGLSLLDGMANAQSPCSAEEPASAAAQAGTSLVDQGRLPAAQDQHERTRRLNRAALRFWGLGLAAAAALTLVSGVELAPTAPSQLRIAQEQLSIRPLEPRPNTASAALPATDPAPQPPSQPTLAGSDPAGHVDHGDDRSGAADATDSPRATTYAADGATAVSISKWQAWPDERPSPKSKASGQTRVVRDAAAKKRSWRHDRQARASINSGRCSSFLCLPWPAQRVVYEPPRNDPH